MERVRPGVELVFATFDPSRELIVLDFPTFDRPKNAISGGPGGGNCRQSDAAVTNWAWTFMSSQCPPVQVGVASGTVLVTGVRGWISTVLGSNVENPRAVCSPSR